MIWKIPSVTAALLLVIANVAGSATAAAADEASGPLLTKCEDQTYALCASSECTVFDGVAYCVCRVRHGTSISLVQHFDGENVCDINAQGVDNGFMVSTYSPPPQLLLPNGDLAVYDCTGALSSGAYAQCDGGLCFRSTQGQFFPGFADKLEHDQLICSCPIVPGSALTSRRGHQILGPYPCDADWFKYCDKAVSNTRNASTLYVGAPSKIGFQYVTSGFFGRPVRLRTCMPPG